MSQKPTFSFLISKECFEVSTDYPQCDAFPVVCGVAQVRKICVEN
jgi:hypothetical protein